LYATTTTDASGNYTFSATVDPQHPVLRGTYFVEEVQQTGWNATAPNPTTTPPSAGIDPTTGLPYYQVVIDQTTPTPSDINFGNHLKASPTLTTTIQQPNGAVTAGAVTVVDRATLSGGSLYTGAGTLSFVLEDASNAAIAGTLYPTTVSADGNYDTPVSTVNLAAGTYHWVVSYSGDANNNAPPAVTNETFTVGKASPTLTTAIVQPTAAVAAGNVMVQDQATLSGGSLYTGAGALSFVLEDASNAAIAGTSYSTSVSAGGSYDTTAATVSLGAGTYHWMVSYSGDANNAAPPDVTNETFTVGKASPTLTTAILLPNAAVAAGNVMVQDQATQSGGSLYTGAGTLTFVLDDAGGNPVPGTSSSTTVSADGSYNTPAASVSLGAGTYHWVVSFSGDANNNAPPAVTDETFTVGTAGPALTTTIQQPTAAVTAGNVTVQDQATLSGGSLYTGAGTLSFVLEDASNAAIAGTSYSTSVSANGSFDTKPATVSLAAGTYHWMVSFSGDANNAAPPDVTNETFTVGKASPTLTTTILLPTTAVTAGNVTVQADAYTTLTQQTKWSV
jgi:hypothetical protein